VKHALTPCNSALSMRLFGEDISTAGREVAEQRKTANLDSNMPIVDMNQDGDIVEDAGEMILDHGL
jgi:hypothetical protein